MKNPNRRNRTRIAPLALCAIAVAVATLLSMSQEVAPAPPQPLVIPREAKSVPNPYPANDQSITQGRILFASQCAMCHGTSGDGRGDFAPRLGVSVPDLTDAAKMKARTDGELFYIVTKGHGPMTGNEKRLSEEQRWNLVNLMRALAAQRPSGGVGTQ